jgi:hypothetical protein
MNRFLSKVAVASALLGLAAGTAFADGMATNPYAPSYGHHYRHGAIPNRDTHRRMHQWAASHHGAQATGTNTLYYRGGTSSSSQGNVGVANGKMKVYLVFYGSGWGTQSTNGNGDAVFSGDPDGAAQVAQEMFKGIGTGSETWSADLTQWCQGISSGSSSCPASTPASSFVPYMSGGILAGVWEDTSATTPINATSAQLGQEAVKAAAHFGNTTPASNRYAYYVILSAHGDNPDNYKSPTQGYCAWHDWNGDVGVSSSYGDIAFSNQPYNMDVGSSCGVGFVNSPGTLDGWTMTLGHEWHETASDYFPAGGWTASSGSENSDECAWIAAGSAGGAANVAMGTGTFTEQASWSNDTNNCAISHTILTHGGGNATPTANNGSVSTNQDTAVSGTLSASDSDGDSLTFAVVSNPSHGSVSITNSSTGAFTYTPNSGYSGSDSFTFQATDSVGNVSNTATESVTVNATGNATPTASNGSVTTNANQAVSGTLSASDTDGDALTFAVVGNPSHGSVSITNASTGAFTYTPASNYSGSDSFTFHATDSAGNVSNTATESVTVNAVTSGCSAGYTEYDSTITQGSDVYEPNGNYYYAGSGYERGRLTGASGTDFDLYLYKWNSYYGWTVVSSSTSNTSNESINYNGSSGYYLWDIYAYSGSGSFTFCLQHP